MISCLGKSLISGFVCLWMGCFLFSLFCEFSTVLYRRIRNKGILRRLSGKWAIVTGCTDGIGLGIARELARNGINLILISRTPEKLTALQVELGKKVETEVVPINFENEVDFSSALAHVKEHKPHILVNNVGVNGNKPISFMEHTESSIDRIIKVNITNTLRITQEYLSWDSHPSDRKYVISTGSMLGWMPSPYQQIYAGTKAFLQMWSESTGPEVTGYHFELLMTGLVCSKLSGARNPNLFTPSSDTYGKCCVNSFGTTSVTYPYFPHFLLGLITRLIPRCIVSLAMEKVNLKMRSIKGRKKSE